MADVALAVSRDLLEVFFPGMLKVELFNAIGKDAPVLDGAAGDWMEALYALDPEVLMTGWGTPRLPDPPNPGLRYVLHLTGEMKTIIPRSYLEQGITVTNWGTAISPYVAEAALAMTLAALRDLRLHQEEMHERLGWKAEGARSHSLFGKRVGFHGFGNIVRACLPLFRPFGCILSAYSEPVPESVIAAEQVKAPGSLDALFAENDVVIELESLNDRSHGSVCESHLRALEPDGVFVNVGRAGVVDPGALIRVARDGRVRMALDVFHQEPLPAGSLLRGLPNVTLAPHEAGPTHDGMHRIGAFALENLESWLEGKPVEARITEEIYDRMT